MNRLALAIAAITATAYAWFRSRDGGGYTVQDLGTDATAGNQPDLVQEALPGVEPAQLPVVDNTREDRNLAAFLVMIRTAEGTAKDGGYGALFGWPMAGRNFDPATVTGHPQKFFTYTDKAGRQLRTSAAGAYQITYTTWLSYAVPFRAWAALNGYTVEGFTPATQDAFATFLLYLDGALPAVRAGRIDEALAIARRRWASLPGAGVDQPERSRAYVVSAYQSAGGSVA